ncbi:Helicase SKI2W [Hordeum vulgare]|nr:Helicase SKI2W [Hordeum vulgare]
MRASPSTSRIVGWSSTGDVKFTTQDAIITTCGEKAVVEEHGDGEKPRPRGKTNLKKEDKHDVASLALQATLQGMITNKNSREEKRQQDKDEQIKASMEIQNKKLVLEAEKQVKMLEIEAAKTATTT